MITVDFANSLTGSNGTELQFNYVGFTYVSVCSEYHCYKTHYYIELESECLYSSEDEDGYERAFITYYISDLEINAWKEKNRITKKEASEIFDCITKEVKAQGFEAFAKELRSDKNYLIQEIWNELRYKFIL